MIYLSLNRIEPVIKLSYLQLPRRNALAAVLNMAGGRTERRMVSDVMIHMNLRWDSRVDDGKMGEDN